MADSMSAQELARQRVAELNLTAEQMEQYKKRFEALDLNKDGIITPREFAAVSKAFGYHLTRDEMLEMFGRRNLDEAGGIVLEEFILAVRNRANQQTNIAKIKEAFKQYDRKKRGYITSDEAYPILRRELGFNEDKTEALVDMYDKNRDYRLSMLEFVDFYKKVEELKQQIMEAFRAFDHNIDGFVDLNEAMAMMLPKGVTAGQVEALFRKADTDNDGLLNYTEFAAFWDISIT